MRLPPGFLNSAKAVVGGIEPHLGPEVLREAYLLLKAQSVYELLYTELNLNQSDWLDRLKAWAGSLKARKK